LITLLCIKATLPINRPSPQSPVFANQIKILYNFVFKEAQRNRAMQNTDFLEPPQEIKSSFSIGSDAHKHLFCRTLLDTHDPYKPKVMDWPQLTDEERKRLTALPIWNMAVQVEGQASINVLSYAEETSDPLLKNAIEMNGREEARHKQVLSNLVAAYGIKLEEEPEYKKLDDTEWGYMSTGYSECIDSFFAFGLFELAKHSGYFPVELVETFEPVMQEEGRHILFFVNWAAWHRHNLPWLKKMSFDIKRVRIFIHIIWGRIKSIRGIGNQDPGNNENFTMTTSAAVNINIKLTDFLNICLNENNRRLSGYDSRLLRPKLVPTTMKLVYRIAKGLKFIFRK
jgi:hypothetical protein